MSDKISLSPYPQLGEYWRAHFGTRVRRISIDAGLGCPNRETGGCIFCSPVTFAPSSGATGTVTRQITDAMEGLKPRGDKLFAAYFQPGTNTFGDPEMLASLWEEATAFEEVVALCVGTRPDCVGNEVLERLAPYKDKHDLWLELGLQTANNRTLEYLGRGHTAEDFTDATKRAHRLGIKVCAHVILGLPGETREDEARTAGLMSELGVEGVKLHQLEVVGNTHIEKLWREGRVETLTEEDYVERVVEFIHRLPTETVLHRMAGNTLSGHLPLAPDFNRRRVLNAIRCALGKQ
jgi:radical SAM protein (TIGR01212 family)